MKIVHITDLHFGTESGDIVSHLEHTIADIKPDLIIISGDFTQIGSSAEFTKARDFIKRLPSPVFCVPGNHDIPRFGVIQRLFMPYKKYKRFITPDIMPVYQNDCMIVVGLNSARRFVPHWNWANGMVSRHQLRCIVRKLRGATQKYRICVLHHPVHKAAETPLRVKVFGARRALHAFESAGVNLVLTGHVHHASITVIGKTVFASASTATSKRLRTQENGFNVIQLNDDNFTISHYTYNSQTFTPSENQSFPVLSA